MLIVLVKFRISQSNYASFKEKLLKNANVSLTETHCHRFDVGETYLHEIEGYEFVLYEEYSDKAAFDYHLTTPHFLMFNAETQSMVENKEIQLYQLIK